MSIEIRYTVMSPQGQSVSMSSPPPIPGGSNIVASSLAKRLDTLENKTVYLVDTGFGGSYRFMQQLQKWFSRNMPSVTTIRRRKPGNVFMNDTTDLWEEIQTKGQAAVIGVGG
jgi:hypothetical protein